MKLTKTDVEKIATLARLRLTDQEVEQYQEQLSQILEYIDKLNEVDTSEVVPTAQVTGQTNRLADDTVKPTTISLPADVPQTDGTSIKVRAVFEPGGNE